MVGIELALGQQLQRVGVGGHVQPAVGDMIAGEKAAHPVILERPAVTDDAQPLEGRLIAGLPVLQQIGEDGVELFLGRVPGLVEVVMDACGVDGADGGLVVGVGREQYAASLGVERAGLLQEIDAAHTGHALVAQEQRYRLLAGFELVEGVQGGLAARGAQDAVVGSVVAAEILHHRLQNAHIVVDCQQDRPRHIFPV